MSLEERIRERFKYDVESGLITNLKTGKTYTEPNNHGYIRIRFEDKMYKAHRLAWLLFYGSWPAQVIDHLDRDKTNNRILNLKDDSQRSNCSNRKDNSKFVGTTFHKTAGKWKAQIGIDGKQKYLGLFTTQEEAGKVYQQALNELKNKN